jgi:type II secretory pathway pseudopilin PulG
MKKWYYRSRGITSIEVVIGVSIAGVVLVYAMYAITQFINSARDVGDHTQALYLAEDGLELVRFMRDKNWSTFDSIPLNTTRYISISSTDILPTATTETIGNFTRSFQVSNVYRNTSTDDIVASTTGGSAADPESKYVTMTVSWGASGETVSLSTILVNLNP